IVLPPELVAAARERIEHVPSTMHAIREDKVEVHVIPWLVLSNVTGLALATGRFHVYRNTLSYVGEDVQKVFLRSVNEMERLGFYVGREQTAAKDRQWLRNQIADAG